MKMKDFNPAPNDEMFFRKIIDAEHHEREKNQWKGALRRRSRTGQTRYTEKNLSFN